MTDVCMILAYSRPECLSITLDHIATNSNFKQLYYLLVHDHGSNKENMNRVVFNRWCKKKGLLKQSAVFKVPKSQSASIVKQSHAVLVGYQRAMEISDRYVFMIEDDIAVSNRFFEWHYRAQEKESPFCSIATASNNKRVKGTVYGDYYVRSTYQSLGVCFHKDHLPKILRHANKQYYNDPFVYVKKVWPKSPIGRSFAAQDGVIHRIIIKGQLPVVFPTIGMAYHFGLYGDNRQVKRFTGTLEAKIARLKGIIYDKNAMKALAPTEWAYLDSIPVPLKVPAHLWAGQLNKVEPEFV